MKYTFAKNVLDKSTIEKKTTTTVNKNLTILDFENKGENYICFLISEKNIQHCELTVNSIKK